MVTYSMYLYIFDILCEITMVETMVWLIYGWNDSYVDEKYDYGHVYALLELLNQCGNRKYLMALGHLAQKVRKYTVTKAIMLISS